MGYFVAAIIIIIYIITLISKSNKDEKKNIENKDEQVNKFQNDNTIYNRQQTFKNSSTSNISQPCVKPDIKTNQINIPKPIQVNNNYIHTENLNLTGEFLQAYDLMENSSNNLFITGKAGTGKSTLLQYFKQRTKKRAVYLAYTGVAALNITGKTIHSFFHFPIYVLTPKELDKVRYKYNCEQKDLLKELEVIIIDEISMVRVDLFNGIDYILRKIRLNENPFGGVQMITIGDMYQLPPVVDNNKYSNMQDVPSVPAYIKATYKSEYFFSAHGFKDANFGFFELKKSYRHIADTRFLDILNAVREDNITEEQLEYLNLHCARQQSGGEITLCSRNNDANIINETKMKELTTELYKFFAKKTGAFIQQKYEKIRPAPDPLELKQGAQVMMVKNDKNKRWVNGSIGYVVEVFNSKNIEKIVVKINDFIWNVDKETWEIIDYTYNKETKQLYANTIGTFTQYPLMPAWAVTIHKSQGKTFETMNIDMGEAGAFIAGQTYVALSRCKTLEGITLIRPIKRNDIKPISNEIKRFLDEITIKTSMKKEDDIDDEETEWEKGETDNEETEWEEDKIGDEDIEWEDNISDNIKKLISYFNLTLPIDQVKLKSSYHKLISQYHPDKVSHLADEFKELSNKKTKEIIENYENIQKWIKKRNIS